ncbi:Rv3235 family protein [Kribbella sp. NPDC002412]
MPANTLALRHQALKRVGIAPTIRTTDEPTPEPPTLTVAPNPADGTPDTGCTTLEPETPAPGSSEANRSQDTADPTTASQRTLATAAAPTERALSLAPALDAPTSSSAGGEAIGHTRGHGGPGVPDVRVWGGRLAQAVSEVLAGDRPISQLVRFTDDAVFAELNRRVRVLGMTTTATGRGAKERSAVRSVRVCCPAKDVAEVAAHVRHGYRSRAIALRLEIRRNRWVCTALELG